MSVDLAINRRCSLYFRPHLQLFDSIIALKVAKSKLSLSSKLTPPLLGFQIVD